MRKYLILIIILLFLLCLKIFSDVIILETKECIKTYPIDKKYEQKKYENIYKRDFTYKKVKIDSIFRLKMFKNSVRLYNRRSSNKIKKIIDIIIDDLIFDKGKFNARTILIIYYDKILYKLVNETSNIGVIEIHINKC